MTNQLNIRIVDSPKEATNYGKDFTALTLTSALIVGHGTTSGKPTVDLLLTDEKGNKYVAMATGGIAEMLGSAVRGKRERDEAAAPPRDPHPRRH